MARLNYRHLHYFWAVAREGHLTRAAEQLHVSQSALSSQIRHLEEQWGQSLFTRAGRSLQLTEAGRMALKYADTIFSAGQELAALMQGSTLHERQLLRIGSLATLSRNFQLQFLKPLLARSDVGIVLQSGNLDELLGRLAVHSLDLVLSNRQVHADASQAWRCTRIARQQVSLVGKPRGRGKAFRFPEDLAHVPLLLPGPGSELRAGFDLLCEQLGLRCRVLAEVDDMAMLRLMARDSEAVALLPQVVVRDELRSKRLAQYCVVPNLHENFYAITVKRHFAHPLLKALLTRPGDAVLEAQA